MIFNHSNYKSYLREVLSVSMEKNPQFSLRAFAKKLEIAPSSLSEILSGKKKISHEMASKLARRLSLKDKEAEYLMLLVELETVQRDSDKADVAQRLQRISKKRNVASLDIQMFRVIADWYHIPIMEMTRIGNLEVRKVSQSLGITMLQAREAIERLEELELIEKNEQGKYVKVQDNALFSSASKHEALRKFHQQMLEKASESLVTQTPKERFTGSETLAFDEKLLPAANEILEQAFEKIVELAAQSKNPKHIYHMGIQLFALTKNGDRK